MSSWDNLTENLGATRDGHGRIRHFGTPPTAEPEGLLAVADHLAVVRVTGADASTFLQGQVSADLREVADGATRTAMHLSLKGRGLVSMRVLPADGGFLLVLPAGLVDECLTALRKFVLMAKVELTPAPDTVVLVLRGTRASENLLAAGLTLPENGAARTSGDLTLAAPGESRWWLVSARDRAAGLWPTLAETLAIGGSDHARLDEILAGEGHVYPGGEDRFMPQELNYDLNGGISFRKGCYVGQEVVARMHFKGKLKQRMRHLSWAEPEVAPAPAEPLRDDDGKAVGEVVSAMLAGDRCHALAVLRHGYEGALHLGERSLAWRLEPLPYSLPEE